MSRFEQALSAVEACASQAVATALNGWSEEQQTQIRDNIANETALSTEAFKDLLTSFATQLASGTQPFDAWVLACRQHQRKGCKIPPANCPAVLGRAKTLEQHADAVAEASGGMLSPDLAKKHLLKQSNTSTSSFFEPFLRDAVLGRFLVWATFDPDNRQADPFDHLPNSREDIRTMFGLGHVNAEETLIFLSWDHDGSSPPLHRPTVADAGNSSYYRPCAGTAALWGLTQPLPPNPKGFHPQPEVVMQETTSRGLRLPFRII